MFFSQISEFYSTWVVPKDAAETLSRQFREIYCVCVDTIRLIKSFLWVWSLPIPIHKPPFYFAVPPNGLVVYCGTIVTEEGKEKKVNIDFEPFKPINTSLYLCDNKFHTEVRARFILYITNAVKCQK